MWLQGITAPNKREDDAMLKEPGSNLGVEKPCKQGNMAYVCGMWNAYEAADSFLRVAVILCRSECPKRTL